MLDVNKLKYYYGSINIIPVEVGGKDAIDDYCNYKRYSIADFKANHNVAILTGTEVYKNAFSLVLDCDINLNTKIGLEIYKAILPEITDSVIVKSGGKHNGFHVHYLTEVPVSSSLITFNKSSKGFIEVKALKTFYDTEGEYLGETVEQMMLPPSENITSYRVIFPQKSDYIDFKQVRRLRIEDLKQKLKNIKSIVNQVNS